LNHPGGSPIRVSDIDELIAEIRRLQNELKARWETLRERFQYTLEGQKVRFAAGACRLHLRYVGDTPPLLLGW
jgi:hypothetical protein